MCENPLSSGSAPSPVDSPEIQHFKLCTRIATCSASLIISRGETVISVLCVTKEVGLSCWINFPVLVVDVAPRLQVEFVRVDETASVS